MDDLKILGLQRAEFQRAEKMGSLSNYAQLVVLLVSMLSVGLSTPSYVYCSTIFNLLIAILWIYFAYQSKNSHSIAERARRAVVFKHGLGIHLSRKSYTDLMLSFKVDETEGIKYQDENYYKTSEDYGLKKLSEIMEESAFWSCYLFRLSSIRYWIYFGIAACIAIIGILLVPLVSKGNGSILFSQVLCIILTWLVTGHLFITALAFTNAASTSDNIEGRLASIVENNAKDEDIIVIVSDYNALMANSPTIPSNLYEKHKDRLNKLWAERHG